MSGSDVGSCMWIHTVVNNMLIGVKVYRARCEEAPWFFASTCILNNTMTNVPV